MKKSQSQIQNNKTTLGGSTYDAQNRLIHANGKAKTASYQLDMAYGIMGEPLTKKQKVDSSKVAQSYAFAYLYEDSEYPTVPSQIGHNHYTYDANGKPLTVTNDSTSETREMYWDEDNRLMVLSDNGKTSRYTYNAGGERIIKSHGTMEGVYINGAPQGITFHENGNYTLYPASIISINKNRFTKHYFIGDKRIASKLGTGKFSNVYGISSNNVTAGQKDYAARMLQIEKQREDYYRKLGTPPGVPTMKGATADPDNTGYGYNTIIGELGDHSVPEGWVQRPKFNKKGDVPGPPIQWQKPEAPDNAQSGYGYVPTDTTNTEDIFFYHSDHLGSTSYITDAKANITQFDAYLPYGELLVDEHSSSEDMPYKFNGKELDQETGLYYYGARYMNPVTSLWYGVDALAEKYATIGGYVYCVSNPIKLIDTDGKKVYMLFYTTGNKRGDDMFYAAALTRRNNILRSEGYNPKKDIVILSSIKDLSNISTFVRNNVKRYSEKYGETAEFSIWSHAGLDGPTGTARTSSYPLDSKQMSIEGWSKINFNWDSNASAYFFGCRTGVGDTSSFTTKISRKHNFNDVDVYGQTSYAYPSQYVNYRENSDWGDDSFWKKKGDKIIFSPTYMVGGVAKHDIFNSDSSTTVYPMRLSSLSLTSRLISVIQ